MTGISINKYICSLLKSNNELKQLVDTKNIVSLYINPTTFPFISIMRNGVYPTYSKEGLVEDNVSIQIDIISEDYEETITIAEKVRDILEYKHYIDNDVHIDSIHLTNVSESYLENSYVQTLDFTITIH